MVRSINLGQYRTKIVPQMRCRFFRQIVSKYRRNTDVFQGILVQDDASVTLDACSHSTFSDAKISCRGIKVSNAEEVEREVGTGSLPG